MKILNKKAAMFGLDARIALAIFGALSVISGAALYSAIQESKVTQIIQNVKEIEKSLEAYIVDTGQMLQVLSSSNYLNVNELVTSTASGWNGPYTTLKVIDNTAPACTACMFDQKQYDPDGTNKTFAVLRSFTNSSGFSSCTTGSDCYVWIAITNLNPNYLNSLDLKIDGISDLSNGKFKVSGGNNAWFKTSIPVGQF
jgi:type II secretory pathway pseudopilin PulG